MKIPRFLRSGCLRPALWACAALALCVGSAMAQPLDKQPLTGVPVVLGASAMTLAGQRVVLWGVDTLAPDQQCWQGETAWCCGEEATSALRHFVEGRLIECQPQQKMADGSLLARCYRQKGHGKVDVSEMMVRHGWALDRGEASGGAYFAAEDEAQKEKRGVWAGRFQTAQDWKDGVQRYVGETPPAEEDPTNNDDSDD